MPHLAEKNKFEIYTFLPKVNWTHPERITPRERYEEYIQRAEPSEFWNAKIITKEYKFSDNYSFVLESKFESLSNSILESRELLLLKDDWDDEGAIRIEEKTLVQAIKFLIRYAEWVEEKSGLIVKSPMIGPLSDGSIDLYWTHKKVDFVINIPVYPDKIASFYGDNQEGLYIEGKFNLEKDNPGMLLTMINLCQ